MESSKRRIIGLAGSGLWLTIISSGLAILSLSMIGTTVSRQVLIAVIIITAVLVAIGVAVLRRMMQLPGALPPRSAEDRVMLRRFVYVVAAETIGIMVANSVCVAIQRLEFIVPLDIAIVGIHFMPLARLFKVPRYYATGLLFFGVAALTLVFVPAHAQVGQAIGWFVLPSLGCAPIAWLTAAANLREATQLISKYRAACPLGEPNIRG